MKQGAIFDMDGLLFDTERMYRDSWKQSAQQFGLVHNPDFPRTVCGSSGAHMREIILQYYPQVDAKAFADDCILRVERELETHVPEKTGVRDILQYFKQHGVRVAVASSSKRATVLHNLKQADILSYFDAVVSGDQVTHGKPAPDIFLLAAQQIGCEPENCYVFEDGTNGIRVGAAAGCTTIMIPDLTPPNAQLEQLCAGIYPSLSDAMNAIAGNEI